MERPRNSRRRAKEMNVDSRIRTNDIGSDNLWAGAESGGVVGLDGEVHVTQTGVDAKTRGETGT